MWRHHDQTFNLICVYVFIHEFSFNDTSPLEWCPVWSWFGLCLVVVIVLLIKRVLSFKLGCGDDDGDTVPVCLLNGDHTEIALHLKLCAHICSSLLDIQPEIYDALHTNSKPVVALESTIITHGMPFPHNLNTAIQVEEIVRNQVS